MEIKCNGEKGDGEFCEEIQETKSRAMLKYMVLNVLCICAGSAGCQQTL